ncbi:hypothetical protein OWV82_015714 [Melia azedarach]|uniref:Uncharacterized protein n=2 Tax=Melia azedarach TaxID=155640 RepID=A0ACC1XR72_MELAZ|nr:hypothetical protein OWV82_015714 [Melia azedarach]KAJ4713657.1 hypothetical protein OWV82_015714 [Melia azedarach]
MDGIVGTHSSALTWRLLPVPYTVQSHHPPLGLGNSIHLPVSAALVTIVMESPVVLLEVHMSSLMEITECAVEPKAQVPSWRSQQCAISITRKIANGGTVNN